MKKLSVIVAAYNAEKYIDRCISSILCQGVDAEIVVVDDGSDDATRDILKKYSDKIKLIALDENGGNVAVARNIGLDNAEGEFITYCDADDWYIDGALDKILKIQSETNADIVRFPCKRVFSDGREETMQSEMFDETFVRKCDFPQKVYPYFIKGIDLNSVCLAIFRRETIKDIRFSEKFRTAEDAAFSIEAYTNALSAAFYNEPLYCYYQHDEGLTGKGIGVFKKYKYNFYFSLKILKFLPEWGMNTAEWRAKAMLRIARVTVSKIRRLRKKKGKQ